MGGLERQNKELQMLKDEKAALKAERSTFYTLKTEFKDKVIMKRSFFLLPECHRTASP